MAGDAVLRYRDGKTERVTLRDADTEQEVFRVTRDDGEAIDVPFAILKAVFFPRVPDVEPESGAGMTIAVEFADGEVIRGTAQYNPERNGFFLYPTDRSKNDKVFVVNSAIVSIEVEKL